MQQTPPYIFCDDFTERKNIAWRIEEGRWDPANPLLVGEYPWETATAFSEGTVLKDPFDGCYKAWGKSWPHLDNFYVGQFDGRVTYFLSEDGVKWSKPMLDGFPCQGYEKSNVLLDIPHVGRCGYSSVIIDPDQPRELRYELFLHTYPSYKNPSRHVRGFPVKPEHALAHPSGLYRYRSADGIHWLPTEGPIELETADSFYAFKEPGEPYVAYHKIGREAHPGAYVPYDIGAGEQRILCRRESPDGTHWTPYQIILEPDWRDAQDTQFMDMGTIRQANGIVAIVAVYHCVSQRMDLQFAGSVDGRTWFRPFPRSSCLPNRALGDYGGGLFYCTPHIIEDGDWLHFYFGAFEGLHGDVYGKVDDEYLQYGGMCRASWRRGRLWAAVPASGGPCEAILTTKPLAETDGKRLVINAQTQADGELSVEVVQAGGDGVADNGVADNGVAGYSRNEGRVFRGDETLHTYTWHDRSHLPPQVALRFYLKRARLYGFELRS